MEKEKNNNGFVVIIVILCLLVLSLAGYIVYDKVLSRNDKINNNANNTTEIDSALLNNLYDVLGINWSGEYNDGDCLNYFLSNDKFNSNSQNIFSIYANYHKLNTYRYYNLNCNDECKRTLGCAACTSILKVNADKINKLYNFNNVNLSELPGIDSDYVYSNSISGGVCHYRVTHDTSSQYIDKDMIRIIDKQVVTDYVWPEDENKINSTKNQTVTYDFKKDSNGDYYLNNVIVK